MRHSAFSAALVLALAWALGACGTKGPLVLPPPKPAPAAQPAPAPPAPDDSKAPGGTSR